MPIKIRYKLKNDPNYYTCIVTYGQFQDLEALPHIEECDRIEDVNENFHEIYNKTQKAIECAINNDTSHIRKLSKIE